MLTICCLFLSLAHDRNEAEKLKTSAKTKRGESFHKHAGPAILPSDALKTPNFCTKKAPRLVLVNIPVPAQRGTF